MAAAASSTTSSSRLYRHLRLRLLPFLIASSSSIAIWRQGSYTHAGLHRRPAGVPAGDGAVAARASDPVLDQRRSRRSTRSGAISSPIDFFWHPGTTFYRVVTSSTVEFSTGIYGIYGQLALTLIAAFLLLAGVANGFDAQRAMINVMRLIAGRSRQMIPQTAVLGSSAIGMISGCGSANAAVVGTITIPLMMRYGVPGDLCGRGRDRGLDGRPDHAADDGRRRLPDGGISRRALLGRGAARLCARLRLLRVDRHRGLSAVRAAAAARRRSSAPQVPLYDKIKTAIFFSLGALSCSI